ncbi:hypothetical protein AMAG_20122 [Allomyces macrogynus ATCC 38327]|uniref:Uncharacterized protein n=1 Tax=Allomyces macrogynus (strain ATCC 38327) TaxID=578462 RepID=A0A0L0T731_ALLM3|nr:hypothetical protein AMAG_20122 [Allomyces macrogynus ATCC 38327]|eukprot:KNE70486.1 hypothetical protein AMAG_20122 [Allomyces macrogynus ATCC 38327]
MDTAPSMLRPAVAATTAAVASLASALSTATTVARQRPWAAASLAAGTLTLLYLLSTSRSSSDDAAFKRALRRQKRARSRQSTATAARSAGDADDDGMAAEARVMEEIVSAPIPTAPEARERFFQEYVARGEALVEQGPNHYNLAAACFYTALKVYPAPTELVHLYQQTLPDAVFAAVLALVSAEAAHRHAAYYAHFPPASLRTRISIAESPAPDGSRTIRRVLVAATDIPRGTPIFAETALAACPSPAALEAGTHCAFCLARITANSQHVDPRSPLVYCSPACEVTSWDLFDAHIFATGDAGRALVVACVRDGTAVPLLAARVLARMTRDEQRAALSSGETPAYGVWDHVDRWRYVESADATDGAHAALVRGGGCGTRPRRGRVCDGGAVRGVEGEGGVQCVWQGGEGGGKVVWTRGSRCFRCSRTRRTRATRMRGWWWGRVGKTGRS